MKSLTHILRIKFIASLMLLTVYPTGFAQTPSGISPDKLEPVMDRYMENRIGKDIAGSAVAIVKDGELIFAKGYGYADLDNLIPVDPYRTVFEYGSISKLFTWLAALKLSEQGRLNLEENISRYLPEGYLEPLDDPVTLRDLMNHRAGFEENLFHMTAKTPEDLVPLEQALRLYQPRQIYVPDTVTAYSNYGTALAGFVSQRVAKTPLYDYIQQEFFDPLGMDHTTADPDLRNRPDLMDVKAVGYSYNGKRFKQEEWLTLNIYPAGAVNGTAADLGKFAVALLNGFSESRYFYILSHSTGIPEMAGNAHGMWKYAGPKGIYGHGGATNGFSTLLLVVPEENFGLIVLVNTADRYDFLAELGEMLIAPDILPLPAGVPITEDPSGHYLSARHTASNLIKIYYFLEPVKVKLTSPDRINMRYDKESYDYIHTGNNIYRMVNGSFKEDITTVTLERVDGKNIIVTGYVADFVSLPHPAWRITLSIFSLIFLSGFFLLLPVGMLVYFLFKRYKNRRPGSYFRYVAGLGTLGFLNTVHELVLVWLTVTELDASLARSLIVFNFILSGGWIVAGGIVIIQILKKPFPKKYSLLLIALLALGGIYQILLYSWNFFRFP